MTASLGRLEAEIFFEQYNAWYDFVRYFMVSIVVCWQILFSVYRQMSYNEPHIFVISKEALPYNFFPLKGDTFALEFKT